jgi:hypothetical protein
MPAIRNMHRKFIAVVLAASVTITGFFAAPARADEDVAKFIAGMVVLGLVGAAINEAKDDGRKERKVIHSHSGIVYQVPVVPKPPAVWRYDLPEHCLRTARLRGENRSVLSKRCLERHYDYTRSLPDRCEVIYERKNNYRKGFRPNCLRKRGYRLTAW